SAIGLAAIAGAALWMALGVDRSGPGRIRGLELLTLERPFPAGGRYPGDPYVGPQACAECHPGESAFHAGSGHARTLRPAGDPELARRLDGTELADPEYPGVVWRYRHLDGQLRIARETEGRVENYVAQYAFGSGHHGTTFVSVLDPGVPAIREHRITYFARE